MSKLLLLRNDRNADCAALRQALAQALGDRAAGYAGLAEGDSFAPQVAAALAAWQAEAGLVADAVCGPCCQRELGLRTLAPLALPDRRLAPGRYRALLMPDAVAELMGAMAWGGFGLRDRRTGSRSSMEYGKSRLTPSSDNRAM